MATETLDAYAEEFCKRDGERYALVRRIGAGNSAAVFEIKSAEGTFALKIYDPSFFQGDNAVVEKRRIEDQLKLRHHSHPNLVQLIDAGPLKDSWFLLMEYLPWPALADGIAAYKSEEIWTVIEGTAAAAHFLEERGFVHRDIKPANIAVSPDRKSVKLLDLGVLRPISHLELDGTDQGARRPFVATAQYSSPEYLFRIVEPSEDLWRGLTFYQLGGVLHDLIVARPLFQEHVESGNRYRLAYAVLNETPAITNDRIDSELLLLARTCLAKDLKQRLERIGWDRFSRPGTGSLVEARKRLRLGQPMRKGVANANQEADRVRLNTSKCAEIVAEWIRDRLLGEGFPRNDVRLFQRGAAEALICIRFSPIDAKDSETKLECLLHISLTGPSQETVEIRLGLALVRGMGDEPGATLESLLWTTSLVQLAADAASFEDRFVATLVASYDLANQKVPEFEERIQQGVEQIPTK